MTGLVASKTLPSESCVLWGSAFRMRCQAVAPKTNDWKIYKQAFQCMQTPSQSLWSKTNTCSRWPLLAALVTAAASSPADTSPRKIVTKPAPALRGSQSPLPERPSSHKCVSFDCWPNQRETSEPTAPRPPARIQQSKHQYFSCMQALDKTQACSASLKHLTAAFKTVLGMEKKWHL